MNFINYKIFQRNPKKLVFIAEIKAFPAHAVFLLVPFPFIAVLIVMGCKKETDVESSAQAKKPYPAVENRTQLEVQ